MYRLLAILMALSQRFNVSTDCEVGLQWYVGDLGITFSDTGASFYMGDAHNNLSAWFPYDEILLKQDSSPNHFYVKLGKNSSAGIMLDKRSPRDTEGADFHSIDDIIDNFVYGSVRDEIEKELGFDALRVLAQQELNRIDRQMEGQ